MTIFLQIAEMLTVIVGLLAIVGTAFYAFVWVTLVIVRFFPVIGKKHRHERWEKMQKREEGREGAER